MPNIVILDDDEDFAEALYESIMILMDDCEFQLCTNPKDFFAIIDKAPVDLVITDIVMPDIDGIEIVTELKAMRPNLPIIAMSGGGRIGAVNYLELASTLGVDATFEKPLNLSELADKIQELLKVASR